MSSQTSLDQRRAKHAWDAVSVVASLGADDWEAWKRQAKKFPVRVINSGLGQALAFEDAKDGSRLVGALGAWVRERGLSTDQDLMRNIRNGDAGFLRRATEEVLAYLQWLNRFAEAQEAREGTHERA